MISIEGFVINTSKPRIIAYLRRKCSVTRQIVDFKDKIFNCALVFNVRENALQGCLAYCMISEWYSNLEAIARAVCREFRSL